MCGAKIGRSDCCSSANPYWPLLWIVYNYVLIQNILHRATVVHISKFHVNAFVGIVHMNVSECDILVRAAANWAYGQTDPARIDTFKQHVCRSIFCAYTIVLVPYRAIMDPYIVTGNIKSICVERAEIDYVVPIVVSPPGANIDMPYFQITHTVCPKCLA